MVGKKRCPDCSSTQTRYRLRTKDYQCYECGFAWTEEEDKE